MLDLIRNTLAPGIADFDRDTLFAASWGKNAWLTYDRGNPFGKIATIIPAVFTADDVIRAGDDGFAVGNLYDACGRPLDPVSLTAPDGREATLWNAAAMLCAVAEYLGKATGVEFDRVDARDDANLASLSYGNVEIRVFLMRETGIAYCLGRGMIMTQYGWNQKNRFLLDARDALAEQSRLLMDADQAAGQPA